MLRHQKRTCILGQWFIFSSCGIVLVTTTASKQALLMREIAGPEKMPWVRIAYTFVAPAEMSLNAEKMSKMLQIFEWPHNSGQGLLVGGVTDGPTCVSHVVDKNGNPIFHVSYKNHAVHLVRLFPLLVNESKVHIQPVCYGGDPAKQKVAS